MCIKDDTKIQFLLSVFCRVYLIHTTTFLFFRSILNFEFYQPNESNNRSFLLTPVGALFVPVRTLSVCVLRACPLVCHKSSRMHMLKE